jgi:phosphatidylglycerol lysyltransferase
MSFQVTLSNAWPRRPRGRGARLDVFIGDLARADRVLAGATLCDPALNAALVGDKRFLFSPSGDSFLCHGRWAGQWVALGGPVGRPDEAEALARRFLTGAKRAGARAAFYNVGPAFEPLAHALHLRTFKTGERALVDLTSFSLDGKTRQVIRTHRNRHLKQGFRVVVEGPGAARPVMDRLRVISDQWLTHQPGGGEKGFGLGRFDAHYVDRLPLARVIDPQGLTVAFATLWPTADRSRVGVDLMRFGEDGPNGVMDFLFAEMFLWAKGAGYRQFDLNTSPGAGVEATPAAPLTSRLGALLFEHGEKFYNFKGVQRFKRKFHPEWEDVRLAWPKGTAPLLSLVAAAHLTNRPHFPTGHFHG